MQISLMILEHLQQNSSRGFNQNYHDPGNVWLAISLAVAECLTMQQQV